MSAQPTTTAGSDTPPRTPLHAAGRIAVDVRRFPWIRPLAGDYAFNFRNVESLYAGDPTSPEAWRRAIERTQRYVRQRQQIASIVAAQQAHRGAPPECREAASNLADSRTVAVVTGQQAGAFGGPLFTLLKAITAIQLARRAAADYQVPVVPVFWVDAEDHDWEEVAGCTVLDAAFQPRTITLAAPDGAGEVPVAALRLDARIEQKIGELESALLRSEFTTWVVSTLREAYRPATGMVDAFAAWLEKLLGPHGLVVFDSSDSAAKPLAIDVFTRELGAPGRAAALAAAAGDRMAALGHQPQVLPQPDSLSLFHLDGTRRPIRRQGDRFVIGNTTRTAESLAEEARRSPSRFSPNVLLRPVVQDTLFPTVCYVSGPSELAYLGQLGGIYQQFGVPMPLIFPRATATLVDSAAARFLQRYDVPFEELQPRDESALNRLLKSQLPEAIDQALTAADQAVHGSMKRVIDAMPALDPTLAGAAKTTLVKMEQDLRGLQTKVIHAAKRRDETLRRQFTRTQAQVFPLGQPQERALAVVFFLNRYGPAVVDRLLQELPVELGSHWVIRI